MRYFAVEILLRLISVHLKFVFIDKCLRTNFTKRNSWILYIYLIISHDRDKNSNWFPFVPYSEYKWRRVKYLLALGLDKRWIDFVPNLIRNSRLCNFCQKKIIKCVFTSQSKEIGVFFENHKSIRNNSQSVWNNFQKHSTAKMSIKSTGLHSKSGHWNLAILFRKNHSKWTVHKTFSGYNSYKKSDAKSL